jgi:hypothetical protein
MEVMVHLCVNVSIATGSPDIRLNIILGNFCEGVLDKTNI